MSEPINISSTTLTKYAPGIATFLVLVVGALQTTLTSGVGVVSILQLVTLIASSVVTYLVPLTSGRWAGAFKTGFEVVGVIVAAVIPFVVNGTISHDQILLVVVAVVKALATEFGVQIRTDSAASGDPALAQATVNALGVADITSFPPADPGTPVTDANAPKHAAS